MNEKIVNIIGGGLAGCEAAYQLAKKGYSVTIFDGKTERINDIQKLSTLAELVCSNSFRSVSTKNAAGILKKELELLDSFILNCALKTRVAADDALAVDRAVFSELVTKELLKLPNVHWIKEDIKEINFKVPTIIATGPLTTDALWEYLQQKIDKKQFYFLDASAPIVEKNSLDLNYFFFASRHQNDDSYLCYPFDEDSFNRFYDELIKAKTVKLHDVDQEIYFKGCQPIEIMAKESRKVLLSGPMSPNKLKDHNGKTPYAVLQLRKDDVSDHYYNVVGFQTNLTWPAQKTLFSTLRGWERVKIHRYGVLHKNNYLNSPRLLKPSLQSKGYQNLFFAGQITGVEGYLESTASGLYAALSLDFYLKNKQDLPPLPGTTVLGALINYVTNKKHKKLKPMKANIGLLPALTKSYPSKDDKNEAVFERSIIDLKDYLQKINS